MVWKMTPNIKMEKLLELQEFKGIVAKYKISSVWCRGTVFLFSASTAILFQDLIQDDETDVFLYDRSRRRCTANMYGIADRITNPADKRLEELTAWYAKVIDFGSISLRGDRKKESLSFSLALLELYGGQILFDSSFLGFDEIFTSPILEVTNEWETCMKNCGSRCS
jgi:hypothetical protein